MASQIPTYFRSGFFNDSSGRNFPTLTDQTGMVGASWVVWSTREGPLYLHRMHFGEISVEVARSSYSSTESSSAAEVPCCTSPGAVSLNDDDDDNVADSNAIISDDDDYNCDPLDDFEMGGGTGDWDELDDGAQQLEQSLSSNEDQSLEAAMAKPSLPDYVWEPLTAAPPNLIARLTSEDRFSVVGGSSDGFALSGGLPDADLNAIYSGPAHSYSCNLDLNSQEGAKWINASVPDALRFQWD
ncbi:hypothetical protein GQ44DRAFT_733983 [Phaeosphaeriaceae sp. PMI808]|nr:hypothetical protein GQ44DRAFT_733983 [Phaeosphaeriaceae sp. PMI808]